jgi:hypothetical protein
MIRRRLTIGPTKDEALSLGATILERDPYQQLAIALDRSEGGPQRALVITTLLVTMTFVQSSSKASMPCQ